MVKYLLLISLILFSSVQSVNAVPDNTMSITPSATSGTTITAADENDRNSDVSGTYNAHSHVDISAMTGVNAFTIGDGAAGVKSYLVNDEQTSSPGIRYQNSRGYWEISTDGSTFDAIGLSSGNVIVGNNDFRIGDNLGLANKTLTANENTTDGQLRWNVTDNRWELSNDVSTYTAIQTVSGNIAATNENDYFIGDGTSNAPKRLYANTAAALGAKPQIRYDTGSSAWQFSNNGTSFTAFGSASGESVDAWVKFDGSGTVNIIDHVNCSSIGDNAAGDWTVNWAITFSNSTWCMAGNASQSSVLCPVQATMTATAIQVISRAAGTGAATDSDEVYVIAIGDGP